MLRRHACFVLLLCLLMVGCTASPVGQVSTLTADVDIAFASTRDLMVGRRSGIVQVMKRDGSHRNGLAQTVLGRVGEAPSWSPDGRCLGFVEIGTGKDFVVWTVVCADGDKWIIPNALYGVWSPDGRELAYYLAGEHGCASINVLDLSTGQSRRLVDAMEVLPQENWQGRRLTWSPSGKWLAYERPDSSGRWGIYLVSSDGVEHTFLTEGRRPDWSPTRPEIAFDEGGDLWLIDTDSFERQRITSGQKGDLWASWSPDGEELVFESTRDGNGEIYRVRRDGTGLLRLTYDPAWDGRPAWRPAYRAP